MSELTYIQHGDYLYPNLIGDEKPVELGKYGRMRRTFLIEHRPVLLNQLVLSGKLFPHLAEINQTAEARLELLMTQLKEQNGVTEELKARDQMQWVAMMNSLKAQAEEIILTELVYS